MDPIRFDRLSRCLAEHPLSRRTALEAGLASLAALDATPAAGGTALSFLFVQFVEAGTWLPKEGDAGVYLLTLTGAVAQTLFFSDRPDRITGTVPTPDSLDALGFTLVSPPNAALVVRTPAGERDVLVLELHNPVYTEQFDADGGVQVTYEAQVHDAYQGEGLVEWAAAQEDQELPEAFSDVSLFIDDCPAIVYCQKQVPFFSYETVGPVPGGPYNQCWDWDRLTCLPCEHPNPGILNVYKRDCDQQYPA
jgi:hypothetical protein